MSTAFRKMSAVDLSRLRPTDSAMPDQNGAGGSNDIDDIFDEDVSDLEVGKKDWSQMNWKLAQEGFRDGVTGGQDQVLQNSFDAGYAIAAREACELGRIQGQISALLLFNRHKKHGQLFSTEMSNQFKQLLAEINSYKLSNTPPGMSLTCGAKERINEAVFAPERGDHTMSQHHYQHLDPQQQHLAAMAASRNFGYLPVQNNLYMDTNSMYDLDTGMPRGPTATMDPNMASQNITGFKDRFQRLLQMCDGSLVAKFIT